MTTIKQRERKIKELLDSGNYQTAECVNTYSDWYMIECRTNYFSRHWHIFNGDTKMMSYDSFDYEDASFMAHAYFDGLIMGLGNCE